MGSPKPVSTSASMKLTVSFASLWMLVFTISCTVGFPTHYRHGLLSSSQNAYNYYPSMYGDTEDEDLIGDYNNPNNYPSNFYNGNNNWNIAQEPAAAAPAYAYDQFNPEDYMSDQNDLEAQWADVETLSNLLDLYDASQQQEQPTWGHILKEEPAELELEELKKNKKLEGSEHMHRSGPGPKIPQPSVKFLEAPATTKSSRTAAPTKSGQKEVPLLRPPVPKPEQKQEPASVVANEPIPVINQRSSDADKKPSPYDTLRKYISIEDALKKEAEKRRLGAALPSLIGNSRQKKSSNFVADPESLTGQLNNLKKSMS